MSIFSKEAEQSLIGGLLFNPKKFDDIADIVNYEQFYDERNKLIFSKISGMCETGKDVDVITIADALGNMLDFAGGIAYLAELSGMSNGRNLESYANAIKAKAVSRQLLDATETIAQSVSDNLGIDEQLSIAQSAILSINSEQGDEIESVNSGLKRVIDNIDIRFNSGGGLIGISTGWKVTDKRTLGLQGPDLIIVGGRPSMGKTTFAMNMVETMAVDNRLPVLVFSMEMSKEQLLERMAASAGQIPFERIRSGKLQDEDWPKLTAAISRIKDSPLFIDDRAALDIEQMRRTARKLHRKVGLKAIVVDYLQLGKCKAATGREQEIAGISGGLKAMAKELCIPVVALSQLNRGLESRTDKRPIAADLRDSGSVEQDADVICMLYRDEVYNDDSQDKGITEILWRKFRNGEIGTDRLCSRLDQCRFDELSWSEDYE